MAAARPTALQTYSRTAARSARLVLGEYSTSFSLACRMLDAASAAHIANIYALVRLADEVVDGVASQAGLNPQAVGDCLDELQAQTALALQRGYSTNLVVHAFALTARETDVLRAAAGGASVDEVAAQLYLSAGTVRNRLSSAIGKTNARNRADAARIAAENGWL